MKLSRNDPLTGELNRTHLVGSLAEAIEEASRFRTSCAFMLIGIDHLARINDAFGFDVADAVISEVARRIRTRLRGGDVLGRFSGNKFGLILKNCTVDDMNVAAERFLAGVRDEVVPTKSGPVSVTASIGAVSVPRYARSADEAINRAHETLDSAKRRRSGSFSVWRPNVERDAQRRVNIRVTDEIVTALNERRIVMAFEPVVEARSRDAAFYECLVRMEQDDGQVLLAPDIVPVAEKLGLIRLVDHRVLELVVAELAAQPDIKLSLNISPDTTMDPDWWAAIESLMRAHPGVAERLIVEITETVAIQDIDDVRGFVTRLKNYGSQIAIDDFGAGYTSFRNLRKLGVDIVKIDGAFVQNIARSADDRAFVQTLIDLARRLQIKTVAEWVQDEESAVMLREWGCDYIQGRLIGLASSQRPWSGAGRRRCCRRRGECSRVPDAVQRPWRCSADAGTHFEMEFGLAWTPVCAHHVVLRSVRGTPSVQRRRRNYSSFFGSFDIRSRRSCMSFIWRRRSSILASSATGSGAFSSSAQAALPARGGTNGLNIEKVC